MDKRIIIVCALSLLHLGFLQAQMKYFNTVVNIPRTDSTEWFHDSAYPRYGDFVNGEPYIYGAYDLLPGDIYWFLKPDSIGQYIGHNTFRDTTLFYTTTIFTTELGFRVLNDSSVIVTGKNLNNTGDAQLAYIYKCNPHSGRIISRFLFNDPENGLNNTFIRQLRYNANKGKICAVATADVEDIDERTTLLKILDTNFHVLQQFRLKKVQSERTSILEVIIYATYLDSDEIVLLSNLRHFVPGTARITKNELRYLRMRPDGEILEENIYSGLPNAGRIFHQYKATQLQNGDWLLYLMHYDPYPSSNLFYPIVIRMNANFTDTVWTSKLAEGLPLVQGNNRIAASYALTQDSTAIMCVSRQNAPSNSNATTSWLHKVDLETGDEIFTKQIEPLVNENDSFGYAGFFSINPSPYGGFLITGSTRLKKYFPEDDRTRSIEEVWLLHIDENGCFLPDCDSTVMNVEEYVEEELSFLLYPNPSSDMMVLQLPEDAGRYAQNGQLIIYDTQGRAVMHQEIDLTGQTVYVLPVHTLPSGHYIANLQIGEHGMSQKIVIRR
ncbi:MAG TPA: T9SS type A sorting domain-containing protein [Saprospiraceae bacterium]|nr:T9SS type A sorting domain-containing protein [Saprospiraceae bacterium]